MSEPRLRVDDFDYELPREAIAQVPAEPRDSSRLLILERATGRVSHSRFDRIGAWLRPGDLLIVNDSRVIPARLRATRPGGGAAEILLLRPIEGRSGEWEALVRPSRRLQPGTTVTVAGGHAVTVGRLLDGGVREVALDADADAIMAEGGEMPLPPYITSRRAAPERYQTVYARPPGSVAAPTAGLHFTPELLAALEAGGVARANVTLHVGLDTFRPLESEFIDEHRIHREWYQIPAATMEALRAASRTVAVGTTSVRVLESAARTGASGGWTDLYITPPHRFDAVDALITNFHLPRSSLLMLVTAFVQDGMGGNATALEARDVLLGAYAAALADGYRFFSFGDAMLIV